MHISRSYALGLLLFTLSWLAYDHYRPWVNFHSELLAFLGLFGLLASVLLHARGPAVLPRASVWIAVAVLVPWLQYATGVSLFAGDALLSSLYLSGLLAAIFVGYSFGRSEPGHPAHALMGLVHCLWIAAMASAAIGLAQWLDVQGPLQMYVVQTDFGDRAMGNLGQPNQLATLLLMGMAAFSYVYERRVIGRPVFFLGIGFMTGVLILTQSRAGMLSALVVAAFLIWKKGTTTSRLSAKAVVCWVACFLIGTFSLPYLSEALLLADVRSISAAEPVSQRWRMWQQIAYAVAQSPWVGYGWNQTPTAHAAGAIAFPSSVTYTNAHNFVMDMLAWNGLPLGILLTGAIAYWFVTRIWATVRLDAVHAMACLLPIAVHSMLEYPFAYAYFLIAAGLMVGIVEAAMVRVKTTAVNVGWAWGFLAAWVAVGSYLTYEYFLIEEDFRIVRFENLRIGKTPETYDIPHVWMASHMAAMLKAARQVAEPDMSKADMENMRRVSERFAYGAVRFRYALALALNGDPAGATRQLAIIRGIYGEGYYAACKEEVRRLEREKYPQLAAVIVP
ncbi:PglL family O-oligosaccharyltransferase [Rhodoferax sp.]|uniref:PglL family O-oligosaccharyltransferase n=1 Tax=Rhodoferax sp. TaxID=50421 RepID=UPI002721BF76|nr:O-antigen ligase family protein [Rhodoferax sp.]MDO9199526.1 Wzy polymerase domain-containing protein [Rhodoferax sp.]